MKHDSIVAPVIGDGGTLDEGASALMMAKEKLADEYHAAKVAGNIGQASILLDAFDKADSIDKIETAILSAKNCGILAND